MPTRHADRWRLLLSKLSLRSGADLTTSFFVPPHSSSDEISLVAVRARIYPVVLVKNIDFIRKAAIEPRVEVHIVRTLLGGYRLAPASLDGEYD